MNPRVDAGEASAIRLACAWQRGGDAVVMDDRAGRIEAAACDIPLIGTAAVIGLARTQGVIPAARPLLERFTQAATSSATP